MNQQALNFIRGEWKQPSGPSYDLICPWTGNVHGTSFESTTSDINLAVEAAQAAQHEWALTPIKERSQYLFNWRNLILRDLEKISALISLESGKTVTEGRAGLMKGVEVLEFALSLQNLDSQARLEVSRGVFCEYRREALGVVLGITPFNFPAMVPFWMIPIALVLGNAFVWKPSEKTPLTSRLLAELSLEAGIPKGVFTLVQGKRNTVEGLIDHPLIRAVGFVGSTPVAAAVYQRASLKLKRALALGGAKNPIILMPDADPKMAPQAILDSFTGCAGQRCMAASLLLTVSDTAESNSKINSMIQDLVERAKNVKIGETMGALISAESRDRLFAAIDRAEKAGAKILLDGRKVSKPKNFENGFWLGPTLLDNVSHTSEAGCEELFGPIISIIRTKNLSEALKIEAALPFGNAASIFTTNGAVAERLAREAQAGMIGINVGVPVPREPFSFGGYHQSKFGTGDITGYTGVEFWSQLKKVTTKWTPQTDQSWLN